ncbi:taste receptor type 2 member 40-like [Pleurodeles waltl]|uniref:taste receptor type 2 member 40-like n=1 Tax=Pleurodeles waltl TaxID=8319 RepID=UPI003709B64A
MVPLFILISLAILVTTALWGIITNTFIVVINIKLWAQNKTPTSCDQILLTQAVFSFCFQCTNAANDFLLLLWSKLYFSDQVFPVIYVLLLFTIFSSFWFTVCLCAFYCVSIVTFQQPLMFLIKARLPKLVPWLLLWSVLLSLFTSVPAAWNIQREGAATAVDNFTTEVSALPKLSKQYLLMSSTLGCCLPLLFVGMFNLLIIYSLCAHSMRMQRGSMVGFSTPRLGASIGAARMVTALLFLYIFFYTSEILLILKTFAAISPWFCLCLFVIYAYSPLQSIILICGSPKLRRETLGILKGWRLVQRGHSGSQLVESLVVQTH